MVHGSLSEQLSGIDLTGGTAEERPAPKQEHRKKPKPSTAKAAKKVAFKESGTISITLADESAPKARRRAQPSEDAPERPRKDLLLLHLSGVRHCEVVGDLALVARLGKNGSRYLCMRFDFTGQTEARWETQILPIDAEHEPGWVSCFYAGPRGAAVHVYDLQAARAEIILQGL